MNFPINPPGKTQSHASHPYEALMKGIPGVVALYLLDLNQKDFPYVEVYAEDPRRLNIQPDHLKGKPYNWHGVSSGVKSPRIQAINEFVISKLDAASYSYEYWDKGALWEFDCRLIRLPFNYLLIVVADAQDWQKNYWVSSAHPLESVHCNDEEDDIPSR